MRGVGRTGVPEVSKLFIPKPVSPTSLQDDANWLFRLLEKHVDLDRERTSRFARMAQFVLAGENPIIPSENPNFPYVTQSLKDLLEIRIVWSILDPTPDDPLTWSRVIQTFDGAILTSEAGKHDAARDSQFELLVQAILCRSGLDPTPIPKVVGRRTPEFRCAFGDRAFSIEAKRIKKLGRFDDRVREGCGQISDYGLPGFLMLDMSEAFTPGDKTLLILNPPSEEEMRAALTRKFNAFWERHRRISMKRADGCGVLGMIVFDHAIVQLGPANDRGAAQWQVLTTRDAVPLCAQKGDFADSVLEILQTLGLPATL